MSDVVAFHEEEVLGKAYDARLMRRLITYLKPYWLKVALAVLVLLGSSATAIVGPWVTQLVIDEAIPAGDTHYLGILAGILFATASLAFVLGYIQAVITTWLGQAVMFDLRSEIFAKLQDINLF